MDNKPSPNSMRVLNRPPQSSQPPPSPPPPPPPPSSSSHPPPQLPSGVVVVGFIGRRRDDVSQLINRIIDSNIFGSGRSESPLSFSPDEVTDDIKHWFTNRRISYFHDNDNNLIFLQLCSTNCPAMRADAGFGFDSFVEEQDFCDLQGMLFMFTVCHVIVYIQEGSRFDTQVLKTLRVLQSAKHALIPYLKSHNILPSVTRPSSSSSRPPTPATSSKSPSPRRGSSVSSRNSSISVMSSLGSYTALFPGQCIPVMLFAFVDDFSDMVSSSTGVEEANESSSSHAVLSSLARSNLPVKGSSSVVVLSRPINKCEGSLRKKLQSSIEAQIRFLIKKCRTLSVSESSHAGSRSGAITGLAPLMTLDASRAVVLLDSSGVLRGESVDFATVLVEDVLSGKATPDALLLESHSQSGNKDDITTVKEFIVRQADILRGKGGLAINANSGSAAGAGMVAAAAAAAAASASSSSGRATTVPELPSLEMWLSSSQLILKGILSAKSGSVDENDILRRKFRQRNGVPPLVEGVVPKGADPPGTAVSILESGKGINRKFSASWCQKALPTAMEVYLKDLPPCYPTSLHESQLKKALYAFHSMVKGPSVLEFRKKLKEECMSIWKSGRQLCDAISLTGRPCMYQRHEAKNDGLPSDAMSKEHSSGYVFLHACVCGRSRQLRADPFDFESANVKFNIFPDCDKLLPMLQLPRVSDNWSIQPSSWTVVRLGGAQYYDPSKGLLQAGFSYSQKFLLKWTIVLQKDKHSNVSFVNALRQGSFCNKPDLKPEPTVVKDDGKKSGTSLVEPGEAQSGVDGHGKVVNSSISDNKKINFGRGLPITTMKKAFSEVVAGSTSSNTAFPPLQPKAQQPSGSAKGVKKIAVRVASSEQINISVSDVQRSEKPEEVPSVGAESKTDLNNVCHIDGTPFLHIGSNVVSLNVDDVKNVSEMNNANGGKTMFDPSVRHFVIYVGFEHECPRGHRFILSPDILNQLGKPYSLPEESQITRHVEHVNRKHRVPLKLGKSEGHEKSHRLANGNAIVTPKVSSLETSGEAVVHNDSAVNRSSSKPAEQTPLDSSVLPNSVTDLHQSHHSLSIENNGPAFSLLNRNLPLYLNCPHCRASKNKKDGQNMKFAGTISQLQRIFVVTPPFPVVLATNPIVQFQEPHQPEGVSSHEQQLQFSLGCQVVLPPESFVSIRLPFVYGLETKDKGLLPLNPFEHQPELTARIVQGTALQAICKGSNPD